MRRRQSRKSVQEEPAATPVVISREGVRLEAERLLLRLMLEDQGVVDRVRRTLGPEDFLDPRHREIATLLLTGEVLGEGRDLLLGIRDRLREEGAEEVLTRIAFEVAPILDPRKTEEGCIRRIKAESLRARLDALPALIRDAERRGDQEQVGKFLEEQKRLLDLLKTVEGGSPTGLPSKSG
jgi:replicative DNA helicase